MTIIEDMLPPGVPEKDKAAGLLKDRGDGVLDRINGTTFTVKIISKDFENGTFVADSDYKTIVEKLNEGYHVVVDDDGDLCELVMYYIDDASGSLTFTQVFVREVGMNSPGLIVQTYYDFYPVTKNWCHITRITGNNSIPVTRSGSTYKTIYGYFAPDIIKYMKSGSVLTVYNKTDNEYYQFVSGTDERCVFINQQITAEGKLALKQLIFGTGATLAYSEKTID